MVTVDVRNIPGTNCYLDEASFEIVKNQVEKVPLSDVHFIGSGNYHYLSYFFLGRVTSPFYLVLFDNHPDCQAPAFGDILSCGGWIQKSLEDFPLLKKVFIVGASLEHVLEEEPFPEKVVIVPDSRDLAGLVESEIRRLGSIDIYISIDKDVLSHEFALTDWDQGNMSLFELCDCLEGIVSPGEDAKDGGGYKNNPGIRIVGVDICGDSKSEPNGSDHPVNNNSNIRILEALSGVF